MGLSLPEHFTRLMKDWMGAEWPLFYAALQEPSFRAVRLHRVHITPEPNTAASNGNLMSISSSIEAPSELVKVLMDPVPWMPNAFYIAKESTIGKSIYHESGAVYIQEPSAMAAVAALSPQPGETILDLCAAPGGKTTGIGKWMRGEGLLVANEIHPSRVVVLAQNLERLGVPAVVTNETPDRLAAALPGYFDAILVDAPCSGEGMFRKDPTAASEWTENAPMECADRQRDILMEAVKMVRPGGRIVYSTCTFNPFENERIITWALKHLPVEIDSLPNWQGWEEGRPEWSDGDVRLLHTRRMWPHRGRGEGHFVARLRVSENNSANELSVQRLRPSSDMGVNTLEWKAFLSALLEGDTLPEEWAKPEVRGDVLFARSRATLHLSHYRLKVLRPGISLATMARGRFQPHHNLAMALASRSVKRSLSVTPEEASNYLAGTSLPHNDDVKDYVQVCVEGLPLGWGKAVPGRINNLYPKGLRKHGVLWQGLT